jgi:hypothetical protein
VKEIGVKEIGEETGDAMYFRIQVVAVTEDGTEHLQEIAHLVRAEAKTETIGLTLQESKRVLHDLQQTLVSHQVAAYLEQQRPCPHCQKRRKLKDSKNVPFRTLFGIIPVPNPRWYHCDCQGNDHCDCQTQQRRTFRPTSALLPERSSPELLYLENEFC